MRIRQSSHYVPQTVTHHYRQWNNSTNPTAEYDVNTVIQNDVETKYMEDVVTSNYRKLVAKGYIINNPMLKTETFEKYSGGATDFRNVSYSSGNPSLLTGAESIGSWLGSIYQKSSRYISASSLDVNSIRDRAVTKAASNNAANDAEILATIGEMKETVTSLAQIFKRAGNILLALKKANLRRLAKEITPKELANRYMEARYAIRPLFYDVQNITNALCNDEKSKRITARATVAETSSTSSRYDSFVSNTYYQIDVMRKTDFSVTARAGFLSEIDALTKINTWGVDRWMTSSWELVPMSFLVDWFFNVGRTIASWQPTIGLKTLASWVVIEQVTLQSCTVCNVVSKWPTSYIHAKVNTHSAMCYKVTTSKQRLINPSLPVWPRFDVNLDALKLLDLGIIMKNALS